MAPSSTTPDPPPAGVATDDERVVEVPEHATRRAPYSDNPTVGSRGLRTQQRILDAALTVFGELGYERSTIERFTQVAGCSRASFYQYFAGKEDLFRQLAGQVARQLRASSEALEPLTPDAAGWDALRAWVRRYTDIYIRYESVFRAFGAAAESDSLLAGGSQRAAERNIALFQSKLLTTSLPPRQLDPVVGLLLSGVTRSLDIGAILRPTLPDVYPRERIEVAITDVVHRALFGLQPSVNAHVPDGVPASPLLSLPTGLLDVFARVAALEHESTEPGRRALAALLEVGHDVIVRCGYQGTRVDDLVEAAGVSHGAFYRYFKNKDELVRIIAAHALLGISGSLADMPHPNGTGEAVDRAALRRWLRRYNAVHAAQGAMIRVWVEAGLADDDLRADQAAVFDWGRRQGLRLLVDRPFGDLDADAVVLLGVVEAFGTRPRQGVEVDAAVHVIERAFLGLPEGGTP